MTITRIGFAAAIAIAGAATSIAIGTGTAAAAPTGGSANDTITSLRAQGSNVIVNKVGSGPMENCSVTSVRSVQTNLPPSGNPLTGVPDFNRVTTVHVGLKC